MSPPFASFRPFFLLFLPLLSLVSTPSLPRPLDILWTTFPAFCGPVRFPKSLSALGVGLMLGPPLPRVSKETHGLRLVCDVDVSTVVADVGRSREIRCFLSRDNFRWTEFLGPAAADALTFAKEVCGPPVSLITYWFFLCFSIRAIQKGSVPCGLRPTSQRRKMDAD